MKLSFFLTERDGKSKKVVAPQMIEIEPFTLSIMENSKIVGLIPLIYLRNQKQKQNNIFFRNISFISRAEGDFLIIYSHGNASDLGDVYSYAVNLAILYKVPMIFL